MKLSYTLKGLLTAGLVAAAMSHAHAAPANPFTVNTGLFDGANAIQFDADYLSGNSTSLLQVTSPNTASGRGFTRYGNFVDQGPGGNGQLEPGDTNMGITYRLWAEYSFTTTVLTGGNLQIGSTAKITSLEFKLYGEKTGVGSSTFTLADVNNLASASVTQGANVKLLGEGSLATPPFPFENVAGLNDGGGSSFNSVVSFELSDDGKMFFIAPEEFYDRAFSSFTNTGGGVTVAGSGASTVVALISAGGGNDFFRTPNEVPEPTSMALIGLGLVGLAAARRRQIKK